MIFLPPRAAPRSADTAAATADWPDCRLRAGYPIPDRTLAFALHAALSDNERMHAFLRLCALDGVTRRGEDA